MDDHEQQLLSDKECISIVNKLCKNIGCDARLVISRLLNADDKCDLRMGRLPIDSLECHIRVFKANGYPNHNFVGEVVKVIPEYLKNKDDILEYRLPFSKFVNNV